VRASGDVGIWHETYLVSAGSYEAIYGNMPRIGLATAGEHLPTADLAESAARRAGRRAIDDLPMPTYPNPSANGE
jgi:Monooxygenase af470-like